MKSLILLSLILLSGCTSTKGVVFLKSYHTVDNEQYNNNNLGLGVELSDGKNNLMGGRYNNSFNVATNIVTATRSVGDFEFGMAMADNYHDEPLANKQGVIISPVCSYNWQMFRVATSCGAGRLMDSTDVINLQLVIPLGE